jgi:hypothetical protein
LRELDSEFASLGLNVRFVVIGDREKADQFCGMYDLSDRCFADSEKSSYAAMGLESYNLLKLFTDPALKKRRMENNAAGFKQNWGATKLKDSSQLPGAALIDDSGIVRWIYRGKHPGDLPPMSEMLAVARNTNLY